MGRILVYSRLAPLHRRPNRLRCRLCHASGQRALQSCTPIVQRARLMKWKVQMRLHDAITPELEGSRIFPQYRPAQAQISPRKSSGFLTKILQSSADRRRSRRQSSPFLMRISSTWLEQYGMIGLLDSWPTRPESAVPEHR